jgi:hypothetical protein
MFGNRAAPMSKELKQIIRDCRDVAVARERKYHIFLRDMDSRGTSWCRIYRCLLDHLGSSFVTADVISEEPGVFEDCDRCDALLPDKLCDMIANPPRGYKRDQNDLSPPFDLTSDRLRFVCELLASPPRSNCYTPGCDKSRPVQRDKYVATLHLYFKDAHMSVKFYSQ